MSKVFLSHSSQDDGVVRALQQALAELGPEVWIDSRQLRGGDPLWTSIQQAIEEAAAYAVLVSPAAKDSVWVGRELKHALALQTARRQPPLWSWSGLAARLGLARGARRAPAAYPIIPLSLDGTKLGVLEEFFAEESAYIPISSAPGGIEAALHAILVALGRRLPTDLAPTPQPPAEPVEELVLELTDLKFHHQADGVRRASARARLVYEPADPGRREVQSDQAWRLIAPLGPIEAEELRWYLEKYAVWPSRYFADRARRVEQSLAAWGQALHQAALPTAHTANVLNAWSRIDGQAGRRCSVLVDPEATLEAGTPDDAVREARECATALLALPWELLHDGTGYLFQGARPIRVRRRLPNTRVLDCPVLSPPIRILLVSARPEDDVCGYIDHRVSALALVEAIKGLGGLVELELLSPPTLPALRVALERAHEARRPYHCVHFDGHGVYDRQVGLGGLCFEDPTDQARLERRRHQTVYTNELGPLLRDHRIPLVFLEACQTAQSEQASESVASELLKVGVASVVAMSHSVLVETARRFVAAFYGALTAGKRVGAAMLAGQRALKDDDFRGQVFGAGELRLQDWFVPVLFQEKADPQLFTATPAAQTREDLKTALKHRLGALPDPPVTGFIGRSRDLLALERLLDAAPQGERWAVIRGQGGEGKTALATELARWQVRTRRVRRAAFCSVETQGQVPAVLDSLGRQLVGRDYSAAAFPDPESAILPIEQVLTEQPTLLVIDNLESILLPPYLAQATPAALTEDAAQEADAILALCARLAARGATRLVFTSREALPAPFDHPGHRRELERLDREDAVRLVERVLNTEAGREAPAADAARESIEQLVEVVHGHARTLALLAPALRATGVAQTRADLVRLMTEMERAFPGSREQSVFAGVELSLQRMAPDNRERARVLGVFHGAVDLDALRHMMDWDEPQTAALAADLIQVGLATPDPHNHLTLNPALCPYLRGRLDPAEAAALTDRWIGAMLGYVGFLVQQYSRQAEVAATLTVLGLANLFALLDRVQAQGEAAATIDLTTSLYGLLQTLGRPRLLARLGQVRDAAARALVADWGHAGFAGECDRIEQQLADGQLGAAHEAAQALLGRARAAGPAAYPGADYDLAIACWLLARVLRTGGGAGPALPLLEEAREGFEAIARGRGDQAAEGMVSACLTDRGDCLRALGRLDEAAEAYEEGIRRAERRGDERQVAVGKGQLGTVRLLQRRYPEAMAAYAEARERFERLGEPGSVAVFWHQTGVAYQQAGQPEAAEDAYRQSLAIKVRLGDTAGQASTLNQLGLLYDDLLDRPEEAVAFLRQAADKRVAIGDLAGEGRQRNNLADLLRRLRRLDEARQEARRAVECKAPFGHAAEPWTTWEVLSDIESDAGQPAAADAARAQALAAYLAYRRDGGENHSDSGRLALALTQSLLAGDPAAADSLLQQVAADPDLPDWARPFIQSLQSIVAGHRDPGLAATPGLRYTMAAELLLLIETLEARGL